MSIGDGTHGHFILNKGPLLSPSNNQKPTSIKGVSVLQEWREARVWENQGKIKRVVKVPTVKRQQPSNE